MTKSLCSLNLTGRNGKQYLDLALPEERGDLLRRRGPRQPAHAHHEPVLLLSGATVAAAVVLVVVGHGSEISQIGRTWIDISAFLAFSDASQMFAIP